MKKRLFANLALLGSLLLAGVSCSIKEDRFPCPCWLDVWLTKVPQTDTVRLFAWPDSIPSRLSLGSGPLSSSVSLGGKTLFNGDYPVAEYPEGYVEKEVRKGRVGLSAYACSTSLDVANGVISVPFGSEAPELRAWKDSVMCMGEFAESTVLFGNQFCGVHFNITGSAVPCPYRFVVRGASCGWDEYDFSAVPGSFSYSYEADEKLEAFFRLPRQESGWPLELAVYDSARPDGSPLMVLNMGEAVLASSYDWDAPALSEVWVTLAFGTMSATLGVSPWKEGNTINPAV